MLNQLYMLLFYTCIIVPFWKFSNTTFKSIILLKVLLCISWMSTRMCASVINRIGQYIVTICKHWGQQHIHSHFVYWIWMKFTQWLNMVTFNSLLWILSFFDVSMCGSIGCHYLTKIYVHLINYTTSALYHWNKMKKKVSPKWTSTQSSQLI